MKFFKMIQSFSIILAFSTLLSLPALANTNENLIRMNLEYNGATHAYVSHPITLMIDGYELKDLQMPPVILNESTLVPAREVFEALGAVVDWNPQLQELYISYESTLVIMRLNTNLAYVNGVPFTASTPPKMINEKTMIPLRFVAETFGFEVDWDPKGYVASVKSSIPRGIVLPEAPATGAVFTPEIVSTSPEDSASESDPAVYNTENIIPAKDNSKTTIGTESHPETTITNIQMPTGSGNAFTVQTSGPITQVQKMLLPDNRLVLDIINADSSLTQKNYTVENNASLTAIRTATSESGGVKTTRVVFDLKNQAEFEVSISADRKQLTVSFAKNSIHSVTFTADQTADYITITGDRQPDISVETLTDSLLVIGLPSAQTNGNINQTVQGQFALNLEASQNETGLEQIRIPLKAQAAYEISGSGQSTVIKLTKPTYKNISYRKEDNTILLKKNGNTSLTPQSIGQKDLYYNGQYIFTLPGDFDTAFGYGEYMVYADKIKSVQLRTNSGTTEVVINQNKVLAYDVYEDVEYIYIKGVSPKEKYSKIVVLDPGHGDTDVGTHYYNTYEKDLNLDISNRLIQLIEQDGQVKVYATKVTDILVAHADRVAFADEVGDIFVSIHNNSAGTAGHSATGTEVYYHPHGNDGAIGFTGNEMAEIFVKQLVNALGSKNRGAKEYEYYVVKYTNIPAVLCEIGFVSNEEECRKLNTPEYRQQAAEGLYKAILETFEVYTPKR